MTGFAGQTLGYCSYMNIKVRGREDFRISSSTTKKQTINFSSANFQKIKSYLYHIENSKSRGEVAHYEPPHQDLRCLQIQLFSSLVLKQLRNVVAVLIELFGICTRKLTIKS